MIIPSVGEGVGWGKGLLKHCWWECKLVQPFQKAIWQYVSTLKMSIPFDPAIPLPGIYPKEIIRDQAKMSAQGCYHSVFNNSEKLGTIQVSNNRQLWNIHLMYYLAEIANSLPNIHSFIFILIFISVATCLTKRLHFLASIAAMCSQ